MAVIGITLEFLGTLLIALSVLRVHSRVSMAHKINKKVLMEISTERLVTISGISLIIIGYVVQVTNLG